MPFTFAGQYGPEVFESSSRALLRSQPVDVFLPGTATRASLFTDRTKATAGPNPFLTDANGNGTFFAEPGQYDIAFGGVSLQVTVLADPAEEVSGLTERVDAAETTLATLPGTYASVVDRDRRASGVGVTRCVRSPGKLVVGFGTGLWSAGSGVLTQGVTGMDAAGARTGIVSRTGMPEMVSFAPASDAGVSLFLASAATNLRQKALAGELILVVHLANQPGYEPGGTPKGNIQVSVTTDPARSYANALFINFGENQLREGLNFLRFRMRNPAAYVQGSGVAEYHPNGVTVSSFGNGSATDIVNNPITELKITVVNLGGATLTFDSFRTDVDTLAQVVLGVDLQTSNVLDFSLPALTARGWKGYIAAPARVWTGGDKLLTDLEVSFAVAKTCYDAGWDVINHTVNHLPGTLATPHMGSLTTPAEIAYEVEHFRALTRAAGMLRGDEFYASPQLRTSRLAERVVKDAGFVAQRHGKKPNTTVMPWGIDNPHHLGGTDLGLNAGGAVTSVTGGVNGTASGLNVFSKIKRHVDVIEAYGDSWFPFIHTVTTLGDTGTGENLTGDDLAITQSAWTKTLDYIKQREDAGGLRVRDGLTGWFYGVGR